MLTMEPENHCRLLAAWPPEAATPAVAGQPGALTVLLVAAGRLAVAPPAGGQAPAGAGALVALAGEAALHPAPGSAVAGVCLSGIAAAEAAMGLAAPLVLPAASCPGAAELVLRLAEGAGRLHPAEASAVGYTLLCRLAAAGREDRGLEPLVAAAVAQMREHHGEVYGIEELAAGLEVSKSHLIRRFTAEMGLSPGRYLTRVRVEAAKRLLLRDEYSLEVVAGLCGFSGANYLCKVFKKETGETPAAWRRRASPAPPAPPTVLDEQMYL